MFFGIFVSNRVSFLRQEPITLFLDDKQPALMFYECLKLGIKNRNSVLNRVGKSAIFVVNRVRAGYDGQSRTSPLPRASLAVSRGIERASGNIQSKTERLGYSENQIFVSFGHIFL